MDTTNQNSSFFSLSSSFESSTVEHRPGSPTCPLDYDEPSTPLRAPVSSRDAYDAFWAPGPSLKPSNLPSDSTRLAQGNGFAYTPSHPFIRRELLGDAPKNPREERVSFFEPFYGDRSSAIRADSPSLPPDANIPEREELPQNSYKPRWRTLEKQQEEWEKEYKETKREMEAEWRKEKREVERKGVKERMEKRRVGREARHKLWAEAETAEAEEREVRRAERRKRRRKREEWKREALGEEKKGEEMEGEEMEMEEKKGVGGWCKTS